MKEQCSHSANNVVWLVFFLVRSIVRRVVEGLNSGMQCFFILIPIIKYYYIE